MDLDPADADAAGGTPPTGGGATTRRLDGLARAVSDAPPGEGNARLNWSAGKAAAVCAAEPDAPPADEVQTALVAAFLSRPIPAGESARSREREALATVASGWRWGSTHPAGALADRRPTGHHDENTDDENGSGAVLHAVDQTPEPGESEGRASGATYTERPRQPVGITLADLAPLLPGDDVAALPWPRPACLPPPT